MCGRYGFSIKDAREVYDRFGVHNKLDLIEPHYNIAPGTLNPVITRQSPNEISRMVWGLIPFWAKDDKFRFQTINARVEGIADKPVYRKPFRMQRCMVPATGFYEWDKSVTPSQPWYFKLRQEELFAFAGLFDRWHDPKSGKEISSYTIITTQANGVVGKVHDRMPVIMQKEDEEAWLNPDIIEPERSPPLITYSLAKEETLVSCLPAGKPFRIRSLPGGGVEGDNLRRWLRETSNAASDAATRSLVRK